MKKLALLFILISSLLEAQNLVPNPSFETYDTCPYATSQITFADDWYNANTGTSDYYNSCTPTEPLITNMGVPYNFSGYQNAFHGQAYSGIYLYEWYTPAPSHFREYLQIQLITPLLNLQTYYLSFLVSCADSSMYATDDFGVYFSDTSIFQNDYMNLNFVPQITNQDSNFITDTLNWTIVKGSFVANGGENYMIIGNFKNDFITDTVRIRNGDLYINGAYYYFDSFCLSTDSSYCNTLNGINEERNNLTEINLYPNPAMNELNISGLSSDLNSIIITDVFGNEVYHKKHFGLGELTINTANFSQGVYIVSIKLNQQNLLYNRKIIITKL